MARTNYFDNMLKNFGPNWLNELNADEIQRSGKRIVKEMVRGQFDYQKVAPYFMDNKFLENLIISIQTELNYNAILFTSINYFLTGNPGSIEFVNVKNQLQSSCYIYNTILQKLYNFKQSRNIAVLTDTSAMLYSLRNQLR